MVGLSFRQEVAQSLPQTFVLPDAFGSLFDWMEAQGFIGRYKRSTGRYAALYPIDDPVGQRSTVAFHSADPATVRDWLRTDDPAILARLTVIVRTGGDGSAAGLWLDDAGVQQIVHLGSGSGSVLACILTANPLDFLRFLAIGYPEPCWSEDFDRTVREVVGDNDFRDEASFGLPDRFRAWLIDTYGVTIPEKGADIVKHVAFLGDANSPDPFCRWLGQLQGW